MNSTLEVSSYISQGKGVLEDQVDVDFNIARYAMVETEESRDMINMIWKRKTESNPRLFNQSKYRLAGESFQEEEGRVSLQVGVTDYKDHVGTNLSEQVDEYLGEGDQRFGMMSQCVGVGGWVVTTDDKVIMVETAAWKGEGGCSVDRPGGHAEPEESLKNIDGDGAKTYGNISNKLVLRELFESVQKEIRDELNIPIVNQTAPELLGVVYKIEHGGRLTMDYLVMLDIDSEKVLEMYQEGGVEADESTDLFLIDVDDILGNIVDGNIRERSTFHRQH